MYRPSGDEAVGSPLPSQVSVAAPPLSAAENESTVVVGVVEHGRHERSGLAGGPGDGEGLAVAVAVGAKLGVESASASARARSGAVVSTRTLPSSTVGPLPQPSVASICQRVGAVVDEPASGAQVIAGGVAAAALVRRGRGRRRRGSGASRVGSDSSTPRCQSSCLPSPLGENRPIPSSVPQTLGATLSRGVSVEPVIQPSTPPSVWTRKIGEPSSARHHSWLSIRTVVDIGSVVTGSMPCGGALDGAVDRAPSHFGVALPGTTNVAGSPDVLA